MQFGDVVENQDFLRPLVVVNPCYLAVILGDRDGVETLIGQQVEQAAAFAVVDSDAANHETDITSRHFAKPVEQSHVVVLLPVGIIASLGVRVGRVAEKEVPFGDADFLKVEALERDVRQEWG